MAQPLKLEDLGIEGNRRPIDVTTTERLITPFSRGESPLVVSGSGAVAAESALGPKAADESEFFSRIGRSFRSFAMKAEEVRHA